MFDSGKKSLSVKYMLDTNSGQLKLMFYSRKLFHGNMSIC